MHPSSRDTLFRATRYAAAIGLLCISSIAAATPINITAQLTGDIRQFQVNGENPTGLIVDVTITSDTMSDIATWVFDINSPLHPNIKLDEFLFNVTGNATDYEFSNYDPLGWLISSPGTVQGAGGASFLFETGDPPGQPNADDVTNSQNLTFTMKRLVGNFTENIFLDAVDAISNDAGQGQLGAHLQGLTLNGTTCPNGCNTDSGFAFGSYTGGTDPDPDPDPDPMPIPGTLGLLGLGLVCLGYRRKRSIS